VTSVSSDDNDIYATIASATPLTTAYWKGGFSGAVNVWAVSNGLASGGASNWTTNSAGTIATGLVPGSSTAVILSATGASNLSNMVLGANMTIGSLTINGSTPVALNADGNTLTIAASGSIVVNTTNTVTINAPVIGSSVSLSVQGGTLVLGGSMNLYTGLTSVSGSGTKLAVNSTLNTGGLTVGTGSILGGLGTITTSSTSGQVQIQSGAFIAPGNSTGGLTITSSTPVLISGTYNFNVATAGSSASSNTGGSTPSFSTQAQMVALTSQNILNINGTGGLTFSGATVNITITDTSAVSTQSYSWLIATTQFGSNTAVSGTPTIGTLTAPGTNFASVSTSLFSIGTNGGNLYLNYTYSGVPEPEHVLLLAVGALVAGLAIRRRWQKAGGVTV
jgi:hypothetical protein